VWTKLVPPRLALAWAAAAILFCAGLYGFFHEHLWAESLWSPQGRAGLLLYASVFWPLAAALVWTKPQWLAGIAAATAIAYAAWWSGLAAPLAVLFLLGSCFLLGRWIASAAGAIT
jgi:hypothetical protein